MSDSYIKQPAPTVSVLLPCYNAAKYLDLCLRSLRAQTFRDIEILALNDGSTDTTLEILSRHAAADGRIRILSRPNRGIVVSLNELIELASGRYLARMDADDVAYPHRFATLTEHMERNPNTVLVASDFDPIEIGNYILPGTNNVDASGALPTTLLFYCSIVHPSTMYRASTLRDNFLFYDEHYPHAEDFELFTRLLQYGDLVLLPQKLLGWRTHSNSVRGRHQVTMHRTHARLVEQRLASAGIALPRGALTELFESTISSSSTETLRNLSDALAVMKDGGAVRRGDATSYDRAFEVFLNVVLAPAIVHKHGYKILDQVVGAAKIHDRLWRRHRGVRLGARSSDLYFSLLSQGRQSLRQLRALSHGNDVGRILAQDHGTWDGIPWSLW